MSDQPLDFDFRPTTYWEPWADEPHTQEIGDELPEEEVEYAHLRRGKFLPGFRRSEVEIAQMLLMSVTSDVVSLRARRVAGRIHYRLVDEYGSRYKITPRTSPLPLTFGELVDLITGLEDPGDRPGEYPVNILDWNYYNGDGGPPEELLGFVRFESDFYPELDRWWKQCEAEWCAERRAERDQAELEDLEEAPAEAGPAATGEIRDELDGEDTYDGPAPYEDVPDDGADEYVETEGESGAIPDADAVADDDLLELPDSPEEAWPAFTVALAACIGELVENDCLIVARSGVNHYVQFAEGEYGMRAEAACNTYIEPPAAALTVADYEAIDRLGWHRPTSRPPEEKSPDDEPGGSPNFFVDLEHPVDCERLAALATATFRQVYRVQHPGELHYKAFDQHGAALDFPWLGIERRG